MATLLNAQYWKKAYLLEFKVNGILSDAFTFSVPPENEEFTFPQRKNETKTFGGAVISDYGNDLVNISLSGSTINQELKLIYKSRLGTENMTGEQEIFYLRDLLKKYGSRDNLKNKEVYLYSLNGGGTKTRHNPKWWQIFVSQLEISRSKDKPFCYNYKFTATGAPEVTPKKLKADLAVLRGIKTKIEGWANNIQQLCQDMNDFADKLEEIGAGFLQELRGFIGTFRKSLETFQASCARYAGVIEGILSEAGGLVDDTIMLGDKVISTATRFTPTIVSDVWNSCLDLTEVCTEAYEYCANIQDKFTEENENLWITDSTWQSVKELFDETASDTDIADVYSSLAHGILTAAEEAQSSTEKIINDYGVAVVPGDTGEDDKPILTYGYKTVTVKDSELNWDQLAQDYYGDASLGSIIAIFNAPYIDSNTSSSDSESGGSSGGGGSGSNRASNNNALKVGQKVLIPSLNFAENGTSRNEVYNPPDVKDNYGKDMIIANGDFAIYNGDIMTVKNAANLEQALLNRYSTMLGARIRLETYGIQASIGDSVSATSALIQASIYQTTIEDPRVESVEGTTFNGVGDGLNVNVQFIDINGTKGNLGRTIQ